MDRIIFKKEIDSIYEKLYSINESLSLEDSKEFIRGYQEGIQEGWNIFQEHINDENPFTFVKEALFGGLAKGIGSVVGGAKGLFQQGKQMAARAWKTVADFSTEIMNKVKNGINQAIDWISEQPAKVKQFLTDLYKKTVEELKSAYNLLKDKANELAAAVTNIFNNVVSSIKAGFEKAKSKVLATEEAAKAWFDKNYQIVVQTAEEWKASTIEWMKKAGQTISDVATKVKNGAIKAIAGVGLCVAVIVVGPFYLLIKGIMAVPELYRMAKTQVDNGLTALGNYWMELQQEYAKGWNQGMEKTGVSTGAIPVRDPKTGRMMPAGTPATPTTPTGERKVLSFTQFVNEKKKKDDFLKLINNKKKKDKECKKCKDNPCKCD